MLKPSIRFFALCVVVILLAPLDHTAYGDEQHTSPDSEQNEANRSVFEVKIIANQRFCEHAKNESVNAGICDIYLPQSHANETLSPSRSHPVILVVHGGGWVTGNKWTMDRHARQLAKQGFAVVSINYRLAPMSKFPDQVDDVRSAMVWITGNAKTYSFDVQKLGLFGYSAGGHLVSLVATLADEPWEKIQPTTSWTQDDERWSKIPTVRAVCIGGPPTDFRSLPPDNTSLAFFLGGSRRQFPEVYVSASPICFASPQDPPFQIIHGDADGIVPIAQSKNFHQALLRSHVDVSLQTLPGKGHLFAFISPQLTDRMITFFSKQLSQ